MKIKLVFQDWQDKNGNSVYHTCLSDGQFHSGTTFDGDIDLDVEDELELRNAIRKENNPVFYVVLP